MNEATKPIKLADPEELAGRLLKASAKQSFDPLVEIDWDAPIDKSKWSMRPERMSLYGTYLWDRMSEDQKKELCRLELASTYYLVMIGEQGLMQMILRHVYDKDPTSKYVQYAWVEIADECRHSTMFAKYIDKLGYLDDISMGWLMRNAFRFQKAHASGALAFFAILFVEELFDHIQRETMADDTLCPLARAISRIHVIEEARHMAYARESLKMDWAKLGPVMRARYRYGFALIAFSYAYYLINPKVYARVGLDPKEARKVALSNPNWTTSRVECMRKMTDLLRDIGALGGADEKLWKKGGWVHA